MASERVAALKTIKPRMSSDGKVVEFTLTAGADNATFRFGVKREDLPQIAALILDAWTKARNAGQKSKQ